MTEYRRVVPKGVATRVEGDPFELTSTARSLFAAAGTRSRCAFDLDATAILRRWRKLDELSTFVMAHAHHRLAKRPDLACEDVLCLLRYYRHRFPVVRLDDALELAGKEQEVLTMLRDGLQNIELDRSWAGRRKRYAAALHAWQARRLDLAELKSKILADVPVKVELHRSRLRDMHMHEPDGFDQDAMCRRLQKLVRACVDHADALMTARRAQARPIKMGVGDWLTAVAQHAEQVMPEPGAGASVTDKATYGMVQVVIPADDELVRVWEVRQKLVAQCRQLLARAAKKN